MSLEWTLYLIDVSTQLAGVAFVAAMSLAILAICLTVVKLGGDYSGPWWHIGAIVLVVLTLGFASALVPQKETMRQMAAISILKSDPMVKVGDRLLKKLEDVMNLPAEEVKP